MKAKGRLTPPIWKDAPPRRQSRSVNFKTHIAARKHAAKVCELAEQHEIEDLRLELKKTNVKIISKAEMWVDRHGPDFTRALEQEEAQR